MKTLNLTNKETSDIKFEVSSFPDGQQNIVIQEVLLEKAAGTLPCKYECDCRNPASYPYQIKSRLNNWRDLELIVCAVASLRELGVEEIHLYTPYIVGARSDRKFEEGGNNYLKDVICPVINSLEFKSVTCLDPHSDVLEACIKNFRKESNLQLVRFSLDKIYPSFRGSANDPKFLLMSPDAGASKKIYKLAEQIGYKGDVITCSKERDKEGKPHVEIPSIERCINKDVIIIDDICDGGATFINIAKHFKSGDFRDENGKLKNRLYLVVTHGIFSKGFDELSQYFDDIYCTNSYKNIQSMGTSRHMNFVKQLNVF